MNRLFSRLKKTVLLFIISLALFLSSSILLADDELAQCYISNYYCDNCVPRTRSDNIPLTHVANMSDEYLTGYIQSLIDMHYYEFQVRVIAWQGNIYVFHLPNNFLFANSILCFIADVPCVGTVQQVSCCPEEFLNIINQYNPVAANAIACSSAYQSMCCLPLPKKQIHGIWLPQNTLLFYPLIADPRQVMNAASLRFNDHIIGKRVGAASFGDDFIMLRLKDILWWHGDMDFGVQAGIFSVFDMSHPAVCLVNTDFFVAGMITYAFDRWSFRYRLWHLSSHLGDEFLIFHPGFDRRNLSDEGTDFFASYLIGKAIRLYAGIGYIFSRDSEFPERPFYFEAGAEIRVFGCRDCFNKLYFQPFLAMHFRWWEEHDYDLDQTYALGVEWSKIQGVGRKFRLFFEYHNGFCKEGQFVRERSHYFALKVNYGF